jgi:hypothetical protein
MEQGKTHSDSSSSFNPKMGTSRGAWYHSLLGTILHPTLVHPIEKKFSHQTLTSTFHTDKTAYSRLKLLVSITPNVILLHKDLETIIDQRLGRVRRQRTSLFVRLLFASQPQGLGGLGAG